MIAHTLDRDRWLAIRDNGGSLQRFLRARGRFVPMPVVKCGEGRNGAKRVRREARREWMVGLRA